MRVEVLHVIDITLSELSKLMQLLPSEEGEFEIEARTDVLHNDNVKTIATTAAAASITITGVILVF
ncbi:MAG TPA: hypothetical protein VF220_02620 [Nitrososphaeraceae archaeon]